MLALVSSTAIGHPPAQAQQTLDFDLPTGGHFYTQANGQAGAGGTGYAITNADGIPFWNYFQQVGGVPDSGYPVTSRFNWTGFTVQAMQKYVYQWRPEVPTVYYVNVLDQMHDAGLDSYLLSVRQVPPPADWSGDTGLPFSQVVVRHQALLDTNPAIKAVYFSDPDPVNHFGLPMAPIQDMGGVFVLRAQRAVIQQWLVATPFAAAGQVVIANGGDLGKEGGLYPTCATTPQLPATAPLSAGNCTASGVAPPPTPPGPALTATTTVTATATVTPTGTAAAAACAGDEQMTFNPATPTVGQAVTISVTSARPSANVGLTSPQVQPNFLGSQAGGKGTIWTWSFTPTAAGRYNFNFTVSGTICTSNFVEVTGASAPTATPAAPTATPAAPTATPAAPTATPTLIPG
jgi:hypothetical protein